MHENAFDIYVKQLRNGHTQQVDENLTADFLDVKEAELEFVDGVHVTGEAYLAGDSLILKFNLKAHALIPCLICNKPVKVEILIPDFYHMEPLEEIKTGIFNFSEVVREAILLDTPKFAECDGSCPKRKEIGKYLRPQQKKDEEGYKPFADLDL